MIRLYPLGNDTLLIKFQKISLKHEQNSLISADSYLVYCIANNRKHLSPEYIAIYRDA